MEPSGFLPQPLCSHGAAEGEVAVLVPQGQGQLPTLTGLFPFQGCLLVHHPGTKGHGQICGGLVTVRCGCIFGCSLWSCRSWTGQCLLGGTGCGAQAWWDLVLGGQAKQGRWQARWGGGGEWPLSGPLDSASSLEHCWAVSGLCPLALGCIALCLQL